MFVKEKMKFKYTALTASNQKSTGTLDAKDLNAATAQLHKMGVAIISVDGISDEEFESMAKAKAAPPKAPDPAATEAEPPAVISTFQFSAQDSAGKQIEGTIDAIDAFSAYKRLRIEFKFKISNVYPEASTEEQIQAAKLSLADFEKKLPADAIGEPEKTKEEESAKRINEEMIEEIDKVIFNVKKTLKEHQALFSNQLLAEINKTLGELERIRTSNNLKHISEVSNALFEQVSNPDKMEAGAPEAANFQALMKEMKAAKPSSKSGDLYERAIQASGVKKIFGNIKKKLLKLKTVDML